MATAQTELKARRWALGAGARGWRANGRAGRAGAGRGHKRVRGRRQRRAGAEAAGAQARGRARGRERQGAQGVHAQAGTQADERAQRAAGRAGVRLGARCGRGTVGKQHGRATCAHRLGQLGARAPGLVFSLVYIYIYIYIYI